MSAEQQLVVQILSELGKETRILMVTDLGRKYKVASFSDRLRERARKQGSWLCIGLDPDLERLPDTVSRTPEGVVEFCRAIVDATSDLAAAYKINLAFFEALGLEGWSAIQRVRDVIPAHVPVIADAKRGDIPNTAREYARALLDVFAFDAVTVSPYLGGDSVAPFLEYRGKAAFVLCKTSNPGARDFQDLEVDGEPLYMHVARAALEWKGEGEIGLVVGATAPGPLASIRALSEEALLLVPGVGAQGATAAAAMRLGANSSGENALLNVSREVLYASRSQDYAEAARKVAEQRAVETRQG